MAVYLNKKGAKTPFFVLIKRVIIDNTTLFWKIY